MSPHARGRRRRPRIGNRPLAAIAALGLAIIVYLVFGGRGPFARSPFVLNAVFTANTDLHIPSEVRVAGVDVGEVTGVRPIKGSTDAGIVTMRLHPSALPVHADATARIRTRTFLEGNFYVALEPGSPAAPVLRSGATLPAANTSGPVQLDRVLSSLQTNARSNLQRVLSGLGSALNGPAGAADRAGQAQAVRAMTGAQGLNYALRYSAGAFEASAIVNQALLGTRPGDLSGVVRGNAEVFRALARSGNNLSSLVVGFQRTMAALAARQGALGATIAALPGVLRSADAADRALQASFAPTRRFAAAILPGIGEVAPTITVALPFVRQLTALSAASELGGLVADLWPAVQQTATALHSTEGLLRQSDALGECLNRVVIPTGNQTITVDPSDNVGLKDYQELLQAAVGIASSAQNFDGNGRYGRASVGGGTHLIKTGGTSQGPLYGNSVFPQSALHTLPATPVGGTAPAVNGDTPCLRGRAPDLNRTAEGNGP